MFLVDVWQKHIQEWRKIHDDKTPGKATPDQWQRNGHVIESRRNGQVGVWCRKCGKYVKRTWHAPLKILSKPCAQAHLTEDQYLEEEGAFTADARLDDLWRQCLTVFNKGEYKLWWNRKRSYHKNTTEEGWLYCYDCKRWWRWNERLINLPKSRCIIFDYEAHGEIAPKGLYRKGATPWRETGKGKGKMQTSQCTDIPPPREMMYGPNAPRRMGLPINPPPAPHAEPRRARVRLHGKQTPTLDTWQPIETHAASSHEARADSGPPAPPTPLVPPLSDYEGVRDAIGVEVRAGDAHGPRRRKIRRGVGQRAWTVWLRRGDMPRRRSTPLTNKRRSATERASGVASDGTECGPPTRLGPHGAESIELEREMPDPST